MLHHKKLPKSRYRLKDILGVEVDSSQQSLFLPLTQDLAGLLALTMQPDKKKPSSRQRRLRRRFQEQCIDSCPICNSFTNGRRGATKTTANAGRLGANTWRHSKGALALTWTSTGSQRPRMAGRAGYCLAHNACPGRGRIHNNDLLTTTTRPCHSPIGPPRGDTARSLSLDCCRIRRIKAILIFSNCIFCL